jgi:hypothetical protein
MILSRLLRPAPGALTLVLVCFATGCGSNRAPVAGSVTLDGRPVDGGIITFVPEEFTGADGNRAMVTTEIKNGRYALDSRHGPAPGKYRVDFSWKKKTGRQIPSNDPPATVEEEIQLIPKDYNVPSRIAEIKPGENKFDFPITSPGKGEKGSPGRKPNTGTSGNS